MKAIDYLPQISPIIDQHHKVLVEFYNDTLLGAAEFLAPSVSEGFQPTMERLYHVQDDLIGQIANVSAVNHNRRVACKAGCSHCCYQSVQPSTSELAFIALAIGEPFAPIVASRAQAIAARIAQGGSRYARAIPCPLLDNRNCSVYAARPQVCRAYLSTSRVACERDWQNRNSRHYGKERGIPFVGEPRVFCQVMSAAVDYALLDRGLHIARYEMELALPAILAPGALDLWLAGGNPYQGLPEHLNEVDSRSYAASLLDARISLYREEAT